MAVKLESTTKRWLGESTDIKPGVVTTEIIPPGSSFLETDTGRIYRWDGSQWTVHIPEDEQLAVLEMMLVELVRARVLLEYFLEVDSEELIPA